MHNRKLVIFPILFSILILIGSSCSAPKTEWNKEGKYHSLNFPKMEWGMSPEEALNAWGLTFSDVTMLPRGDSYYDVIVLNVPLPSLFILDILKTITAVPKLHLD